MTRTPLLLLPGLLEDADSFAHQAAGLAETAQITVADLTASSTMADLARDALRQAAPGKLAIAGHSMGGYVALEIMRQAPERVTRLALLNTNARADSAEATENRRRLMALAQTDFDAVVSTLMQRQMTPEHLADAAITASEVATLRTQVAELRGELASLSDCVARICKELGLPPPS